MSKKSKVSKVSENESKQVCRNCKFWNAIPEKQDMGDCYGHVVPGSMNVSQCPAHAFQLRQ